MSLINYTELVQRDDLVGMLNVQQHVVITMRYGLDGETHTLEECAVLLDTTPDAVREIESLALTYLASLAGVSLDMHGRWGL